jgi:uncharacterized protein
VAPGPRAGHAVGVSILEQLLGVQELDTHLDQLRHRRSHLPERAELADLEKAETELSERRSVVDEQAGALARSQKRLEDEIASVEAKRADTDQRLYSGTITAPRELQALQDEVASLGRRTSELEDELLEVFTATEPVDEALAGLAAEAAALAEKRSDVEARLAAVEAEIDAEIASVEASRADATGPISDEQLADYDRRRKSLGGIAVARLVGSSCGGCHLMLSAVELDRIRKLAPDELASCEECGRLLVR